MFPTPPPPYTHTLSLTLASRVHIYTCTHSVVPTLSYTFIFRNAHSVALTFNYKHIHIHTCTHTVAGTLNYTHMHILSRKYAQLHSHTNTHTLNSTHAQEHTLSHSEMPTHSHTRSTHTQIHVCTPSHELSLSHTHNGNVMSHNVITVLLTLRCKTFTVPRCSSCRALHIYFHHAQPPSWSEQLELIRLQNCGQKLGRQ
jgi:hypothetical protein